VQVTQCRPHRHLPKYRMKLYASALNNCLPHSTSTSLSGVQLTGHVLVRVPHLCYCCWSSVWQPAGCCCYHSLQEGIVCDPNLHNRHSSSSSSSRPCLLHSPSASDGHRGASRLSSSLGKLFHLVGGFQPGSQLCTDTTRLRQGQHAIRVLLHTANDSPAFRKA
jgi:hypothetical protein